jgi:hypothetical protein
VEDGFVLTYLAIKNTGKVTFPYMKLEMLVTALSFSYLGRGLVPCGEECALVLRLCHPQVLLRRIDQIPMMRKMTTRIIAASLDEQAEVLLRARQ